MGFVSVVSFLSVCRINNLPVINTVSVTDSVPGHRPNLFDSFAFNRALIRSFCSRSLRWDNKKGMAIIALSTNLKTS